jgi:hypothetical protein
MYQRSCDLGLGVPFNIASYALLTHMIAYMTDTEPHEFILQMGDAHVYKDHVEPLKEQLGREPRAFPTLKFGRSREEIGDIDGFRTEDFVVEGYKPMGKIEMKMSVGHCVGCDDRADVSGLVWLDIPVDVAIEGRGHLSFVVHLADVYIFHAIDICTFEYNIYCTTSRIPSPCLLPHLKSFSEP